jgi:hypothetical protein
MTNRESQLFRLVIDSLNDGNTVIIIDKDFRGNSFLTKHISAKVFEFFDFETKWAGITMSLAQLYTHKGPCVVHTNLDGVRGADFRVQNENVEVILAFIPQKAYEITQAIGRGMRGVNTTC